MINNPSALCFGEILFDVFGDDRCIGGAPFNFAAHFAQLGGEAVMVSAVGAGDGYSARFMYDYLRGRPIDECIENATKLAERICGQKGAI